jgi:hypothetical protein
LFFSRPQRGHCHTKGRKTTITVIIGALIFAAIGYYYDERSKAREALRKQVEEFEQERKKSREDLVRFGATDVIAYGAVYGLVTGGEMSDDALIRAETKKWTILNGGRQLAKILLKGGAVTVNYDAACIPTLDLNKANPLLYIYEKDFEPFVLSEFQVVRPNPGTALLTYKANAGHSTLTATAVWARHEGRKWRTISYQVG